MSIYTRNKLQRTAILTGAGCQVNDACNNVQNEGEQH